MKYLWMALLLMGCASSPPPVVLGHCEIPMAYDYVAPGPVDFPVAVTPIEKHLQDELAERHEHKVVADDFNGLHDYVRDQCNVH